jgi:hypothetical protein
MNPSVLVVHASERGSTREVAKTVAATVREQGLDVVAPGRCHAGPQRLRRRGHRRRPLHGPLAP